MAVFRVERNSGYTVMSNHHLRNKELTLKAKGLLSQMLSLPEDWDYFNADGFIFYIKNIDYLWIRYGSKYQTLRSLLKWVFFSNMVLVFTTFVGAVVALYFCTGSLSGSFSMDSIAILARGFFHCVILAFFQVMLLIRVGETKCFGVILLLAVGYTFLKLSYSPLDSSAFLYSHKGRLQPRLCSAGTDHVSHNDCGMGKHAHGD